LSEESKRAATVTDVNKFSSTIFSPRKGGERLKNGDYRVVRKLAGKPLSAVYLARDRAEKHVVIKEFVLPTCVEQCERLDETFDREYRILRSLHHECIAKVLETFEEKGAKYIVIEHIRGQDLRSLVQRRGRRSEKSVQSWALQIAGLMRYLHEQDPAILHRDLTPDNLMEDEDGNLVLIDFGAAHQFLEGVTGTLIGKQCYIAPEQLRGKPCIQSDIYSYGCTLQFLITGGDPAALQQSDPAEKNVTTSQLLRQMIMKCTEFEPSKRYDSFAQIIRELEGTKDVRA
jgi:serine/threonine-protein kinase